MNHINQVTRILNTLYDIEYINVLCTTVENDMLIIDLSYRNENAKAIYTTASLADTLV